MAGDGPLPSQGYVGFSALGLVSRYGGAVRRTRPPAASDLCLSATQGPGAGKARQGVDGGIALPRLSGAVDCRFGCAAGGRHAARGADEDRRGGKPRRDQGLARRTLWQLGELWSAVRRRDGVSVAGAAAVPRDRRKIGRASCRERVGRYV